jgi:hypothetical protein
MYENICHGYCALAYLCIRVSVHYFFKPHAVKRRHPLSVGVGHGKGKMSAKGIPNYHYLARHVQEECVTVELQAVTQLVHKISHGKCNNYFLGPNWHFKGAQKTLDFQGQPPPPPLPHVMYLPPSKTLCSVCTGLYKS